MPRYRIDHVKHTSPHRRYEYLREHGVLVPTGIGDQNDRMKGKALDDYIDEKVWREKNPTKDAVKEWD